MEIKAVIFDIGGVLLEDPSFASFWQGKDESKELRSLFGTGGLTKEELIVRGSRLLDLSPEEFLTEYSLAYSMMQPITHVVDIYNKINKLKYIFSDTNPVHFEFCMQKYSAIFSRAHKLFLSHEVRFRKESDSSYEYILSQIPFKPSELIFIDNKGDYIEKANKFGINGILYNEQIVLEKELLFIDPHIFD